MNMLISLVVMTCALTVFVVGMEDWDLRYRPEPITAAMHWRGIVYGFALVALAGMIAVDGVVVLLSFIGFLTH